MRHIERGSLGVGLGLGLGLGLRVGLGLGLARPTSGSAPPLSHSRAHAGSALHRLRGPVRLVYAAGTGSLL